VVSAAAIEIGAQREEAKKIGPHRRGDEAPFILEKKNGAGTGVKGKDI